MQPSNQGPRVFGPFDGDFDPFEDDIDATVLIPLERHPGGGERSYRGWRRPTGFGSRAPIGLLRGG